MALVTTIAMREGKATAFYETLGIVSGLPLHAAASAIGLAVVVATSVVAFTAIKTVGAAYVVFLGVQAIRRAQQLPDGPAAATTPASKRVAYLRGFLTNA